MDLFSAYSTIDIYVGLFLFLYSFWNQQLLSIVLTSTVRQTIEIYHEHTVTVNCFFLPVLTNNISERLKNPQIQTEVHIVTILYFYRSNRGAFEKISPTMIEKSCITYSILVAHALTVNGMLSIRGILFVLYRRYSWDDWIEHTVDVCSGVWNGTGIPDSYTINFCMILDKFLLGIREYHATPW